MTRALKLRMVSPTVENGASEPMKRKDRFEEVLDAFASDFAPEELAPEDLDKLYSSALSEGLLAEEDVNSSFEAFLDREVRTNSSTGELSLAPAESPTVGSLVQAYCEHRSLSSDELAREHNLTAHQVQLLESSAESFDPNRVADIARAVAARTGIAVPRLHTLLQNIRATLELKSALGPTLMAARRVPPK
jgi:hypothetical protein